MKRVLILLILPLISIIAQNKDCIFEQDIVNDSTYTKVLPYKPFDEVIVGDNTNVLSGRLFVIDGKLGFNIQYLQKSKEFIPVFCMDKTSKMVIGLGNGKDIKLINAEEIERCNELNYNPETKDNFRILEVFFHFTKENFDFLKTEKINVVTIYGATGEISFIMKSKITSELTKESYTPEMYFVDHLKCFDLK